jgi:hypothetical protein
VTIENVKSKWTIAGQRAAGNQPARSRGESPTATFFGMAGITCFTYQCSLLRTILTVTVIQYLQYYAVIISPGAMESNAMVQSMSTCM